MVIHDVKHPTTSLISILRNMSAELSKIRDVNTAKIIKNLDKMNNIIDTLVKKQDISEDMMINSESIEEFECKMGDVNEGNDK